MSIEFTSANSDDNPYNDFVYTVQIDGVEVGGFEEVDGLRVRSDVLTYQEGGLPDVTHTFPTTLEYSNVTLRRGVTQHDDFITWITESVTAPTEAATFDALITMKDRTGSSVWGWKLIDAYPVLWDGPKLVGTGNGFSMERIELAYQELDFMKF